MRQTLPCFLLAGLLLLCFPSDVLASEGHANPRLRVELLQNPKRIVVRDRLCREQAPEAVDLRRRIVALAAREWEAFRFQTLDIASRGLPAVPTLGTLLSRTRPRTILPPSRNPPLPETYARRLLRLGLAEDAGAVTLRIGGYWAAVPDGVAVDTQNQLWRIFADTGWAQPWSAAFVSWVMCEAGLPEAAFARSGAHASYLEAIFSRPEGSAFSPRDLVSGLPQPGDLLCAGRASAEIKDLERARAAAPRGAPMHCDIVVGGARDRIYAIGGNVENSVTLTVAPVSEGRVLPTPARPWFGFFSLRAPADPRAGIGEVPFACLGKPEVDACLAGL